MLSFRVIQDTFFKQSTQNSDTSPANQKALVTAKKEFKIKSYFKKDGHYFVKLAEEILPLGKTGFFLKDSLQIEEIRGVWLTNIDSDILKSKDNLKRGIQKLQELRFNTIYPVVWNRGFTFYKSPIAKNIIGSEITEEFKDRDILAEIIEIVEQEKYNFRVIPWFEYGLMTPPKSPLANNKPEWITQKNTNDANKNIENGNCWLNPAHPDVQKFMTELIADVVKKYNIDGIQLDDHFGMPASMGFDAFTQQLFKDENGNADPSKNPNSELFKTWRMSKVSNLLKQIFTAVKAQKEDCILSLSPNPLGFSINKFLSDWRTWEQEGFIEELVLQVYRPNLSRFEGEIKKPEVEATRNHIPTVIGILTGLKPENKRMSQGLIKQQLQATRERDFAGFSFFFFGSLFDLGFEKETPEEREELFTQLLSIDRFV